MLRHLIPFFLSLRKLFFLHHVITRDLHEELDKNNLHKAHTVGLFVTNIITCIWTNTVKKISTGIFVVIL